MTKKKWVAVAAVVTALAVPIGALSVSSEPASSGSPGSDKEAMLAGGPKVLSPSWVFRPDTLNALAEAAPIAVSAEVVAVAAGPPLVDDSQYHASGLPTQRISLKTQDRVFGDVPATFALFKTGSQQVLLEGDPPYAVGERYLLFVEPRFDGNGAVESGTYVPVAPDGRLRIVDNVVQPVIEGSLGEKLRGRAVTEVKAAAQNAKKGS